MGNVSSEGRPVAKKGLWPVGDSVLMHKSWIMYVMLSLPMALASVASGRCGHRQLYTTLAGFNVGLVSDGR